MREMMKSSLVLVLSMFTLTLLAQDKVFVVDSIMNEYMVSGYANEHFLPKGKRTKKNERTGKWKDYEVDFENVFLLKGENKRIVRNGTYLIYSLGKYVDDKRTGKWEHYVLEDKSFEKMHFKTSTYVNGLQEGEAVYYFPNGKLAAKGFFKNDSMNGEFTEYYPNGKIAARTMFVMDFREGVQTNYFPSGEVQSTTSFVNDKVHGEQIFYYEDGSVQLQSVFSNGLKDGMYRYYRKNGKIWTEKEYREGLLLSVKTYSESGEELENGTLQNGNGTVKYFQETGEVYLIETYEEGNLVSEERFGDFKW